MDCWHIFMRNRHVCGLSQEEKNVSVCKAKWYILTNKGESVIFPYYKKLVKRASFPLSSSVLIFHQNCKIPWSKPSSHHAPTTSSTFIANLRNHPNIMLIFLSLYSIIRRVTAHWPLLLCAATWTILLTLTVALASFAPEFAFVSAISPSSSFSKSCHADGFVRIPLDFPKESVCLPSYMVRRSKMDFFVPTVFAALVVAGSAFAVRSLGLWESGRAWFIIHGHNCF